VKEWVICNDSQGRDIHINVANAVSMLWEDNVTIIVFAGDAEYVVRVKQTPEQIFTLASESSN
jgi:hypothetical protein